MSKSDKLCIGLAVPLTVFGMCVTYYCYLSWAQMFSMDVIKFFLGYHGFV